jgi:hypothetical protein
MVSGKEGGCALFALYPVPGYTGNGSFSIILGKTCAGWYRAAKPQECIGVLLGFPRIIGKMS